MTKEKFGNVIGKTFAVIIGMVIGTFIIFAVIKIVNTYKVANQDYDYICNIDPVDSSDETFYVESYRINGNDAWFKLLDGRDVYMQINDNVITCEKYKDEGDE